ncbi:uncharacterized protein LOC112258947 [Oncorhynchus tshawytscha]|uniref:uncharacterized protein LOC112258947 n=1 Tax=Oncorhynchus tshawytscha TaxID=74940 RepID=UPI001C3C2981|nr:uncharacterized protein LOC112258947 [Oncorhynchus tshawytscha]XP_042163279.1 uncharacterized protein LOC112258947 [Oncorhynchus tshawytscha]
MELSSQDPHPMALDLSKRCGKSHLNPRTTEVLDLMKKPNWHSITDDHVSMPCMQLLSEKTLTDTGVRLSYGTRTCVRSPLLHNGMDRSLRDSGLYEPHPTESLNAESPISESIEGDESQSDSDVILLVSSSKEAPSLQDYLDRGSVSPLVDSPSPGAVSLGEAKGCFLLPQTLSSPSPDNTYSEDSSESTEEMSVNAKPVLNLSELAAVYGKYVRSPVDISSDDSDVIEVPITNEKKKIRSLPVDVQNEKRLTGEASNVVKKSLSPILEQYSLGSALRNSSTMSIAIIQNYIPKTQVEYYPRNILATQWTQKRSHLVQRMSLGYSQLSTCTGV